MSDCCSTVHRATSAHFDDRRAREELAAYHRSGAGRTTHRLLSWLRDLGASGGVLDVGAGVGVLSFELLKAGMSTATCVDLSGQALGAGREEAGRQGLAGRITWREGDFVSLAPTLPDADVVTLDRVVCCYPAYAPLLQAAASRCRRLLAMSYPRDRWFVRLVLRVENLGRRLRRDAFRAFVHPVGEMDAVLRRAGFEVVRDDATLAWAMRVYHRRG